MIRKLKDGIDEATAAENDAKVRQIVEQTLADIQARGDAAVKDYANKFDNWEGALQLSREDIEACYQRVSESDQNDIRFAQEQVRNFAQIQKDALQDVEVETLPGVTLGHIHATLKG